jgi:hypothetical protein
MKTGNSTYWQIVDTKYTVFGVEEGTCTFTFTFQSSGTYVFKAVFEGGNILQSSESQQLTFTVS